MLNSEIINQIIANLMVIVPEKVILFGSYAYGTPNVESDIDLLIIKNIQESEVRTLRLQIKKLLWISFKGKNLSFDVLVDSEQRVKQRISVGDLYYNEIYNKGKLIYAQ
jgi:uncharacterized protein